MRNIVVALTGASGVILGIRLLEKLKENEDVRTSLILSEAASQNILLETDYQISEVCVLADAVYDNADFSAPIASGSYPVDTMVVLPCSMKTLSAICHGYDATLIARAGDVTLKERRQLILCPRETPLHAIHLENMLKLAQLGVSIIPPILGFYTKPKTVEDLISHFLMKIFDAMKLPYSGAKGWGMEDAERWIGK